jgi:alpha-1,2-mannosyltransferase
MTSRRAATLQPSTTGWRPSLAYLSMAGVVACLVWLRWSGIRKGIWVDLDVYVRGAAAVAAHEPLYSVSVHGLPFTYSPFAAVLFMPLQLFGVVGARWALTVASIGCYVLVVVVCARRLRMNPPNAALVGLAGLTVEPFLRNILLGQINLVLLALIVVDCFVVPPRYRGMLIGIATGVKLVPGAFVLFLVLKRDWAAAGRAVAAFFVTIGVGAAFAPRDSLLFWSGGFIKLSRFGSAAIIGGDNQSLNAALMRLTHDLTPPFLLVLLLSLSAMALGLVAAKRQIDLGNEVNALVCIAIASLLASPISWTHHWVWVVPALLVLVQARQPVVASAVGLVFVVGPMWLARRGQLVELRHTWWEAAVCVSYVVIGLTYLAFFAAGRGDSDGPPSVPRAIGRTDDAVVSHLG